VANHAGSHRGGGSGHEGRRSIRAERRSSGVAFRGNKGATISYFDLPRIHLLGTFFTDPSTVNNDPSHYDSAVDRPSPWQSPNGLHRFMFVDVKVNAATDANGEFVQQDALLGAQVTTNDSPSAAKLVDLDVYQQAVPTIFGLGINIAIAPGVVLAGFVDPVPSNGLRFTRVLPTRGWQAWDSYEDSSFGGDTYACAVFQTVVRIPAATWPTTTSSVLSTLRSATSVDAEGNVLIAIRMVLDAFQNVPWHADFCTGRVLATLGPVPNASEVATVVGGHWLDPRPVDKTHWYSPDFYGVPAVFVDRPATGKRLVLDLANAMALQQPGGPPVPTGDLSVRIGDGASGEIGPFQATQDLYQNFGGIIELPVSDQQWSVRNRPLVVSTTRDDIGGPELWFEAANGLRIEAADRVFRLRGAAGTSATARVRISRFGQPAIEFEPAVIVVPVTTGNLSATVPWNGEYVGDTPQAAGKLTASITPVDSSGSCTVTLTVQGDPGARTDELDGQLYFIVVFDPKAGAPDMNKVVPPQESVISCVVYSACTDAPTWETVRAVMVPYAKLYPGMTDQIDLTQEQAFFTFAVNPSWAAFDGPNFTPYVLPDGRKIGAGAIPYVMTRPFDDPRYMPVSRDLSADRLLMILNYIADIQTNVKPTPPPPHAPAQAGPT
jgi:hypothetical protein